MTPIKWPMLLVTANWLRARVGACVRKYMCRDEVD